MRLAQLWVVGTLWLGACEVHDVPPSVPSPGTNIFFDIQPTADVQSPEDTRSPGDTHLGDTDAHQGGGLVLEGPRRLLPGRSAPLAIRTGELRDAVVKATVGTSPSVDLKVHRGRGVLRLEPDGLATEVKVTLDGQAVVREVVPFDAARDVRVTGELVVPVGETLVWPAGTRVMISAGATVKVAGRLEIQGSAEDPVLVTSATSNPWGTIEVMGELVASHTWFTAGGAGTPRFGGHSASNPVVAVLGGRLEMTGGGLTDNVGKAIHAERGRVKLDGVLIARCDTGGEYVESVLRMDGSHVIEIPDGDGVADDDDNDGVYFRLALVVDGVPQVSEIVGSVFAFGEDDGIDHNGGHVLVRDTIIEGFANEGVAASNGGRIEVVSSLIRATTHGVEAGYGAPEVIVRRSTLTGSKVGLRWGDEYDWESKGSLWVEDSVVVGNERDIVTRDPQQGEAPEGSVVLSCTAVGESYFDRLDARGCFVGDGALEDCSGPIGWECSR
jgi:hypothetical protein